MTFHQAKINIIVKYNAQGFKSRAQL